MTARRRVSKWLFQKVGIIVQAIRLSRKIRDKGGIASHLTGVVELWYAKHDCCAVMVLKSSNIGGNNVWKTHGHVLFPYGF